MKLSPKSKVLMSFLTKNNYIHHFRQTDKTNKILRELYVDILNAYKYLLSVKQAKGDAFYDINIKKIVSAYQIVKPRNFNSKHFPEEIRKHIDKSAMAEITYTFSLFHRNIKIIFTVEDDHIESKIETYNQYVDSIIMWLYILNQYSSKQCSNTLVVYFYFTSLEKQLPDSNIMVLDENNVNTAFTETCPKDSEIVVFRKEEWFKVFIHETFHNFGLDFSDMNNSQCTRDILNLFPVDSTVNLYESYTELWAEIMNALFCSFFKLKNKNNIDEFLLNAEFFINFERSYSFFQLVKTLHFMGLSYNDLYSKTPHSKILRETMYKEKTNVLSYYVIKTILLNNYQGFLSWCKTNNLSLLQFKKTLSNQTEYCRLIERNYKTKSMLEGVDQTQQFLIELRTKKNRNSIANKFIMSNLRMSICELG